MPIRRSAFPGGQIVRNKANLNRDQVSGVRDQQTDTRYPTPEPRTSAPNKANFRQSHARDKCLTEKDLW
jgi:hypothetical protein